MPIFEALPAVCEALTGRSRGPVCMCARVRVRIARVLVKGPRSIRSEGQGCSSRWLEMRYHSLYAQPSLVVGLLLTHRKRIPDLIKRRILTEFLFGSGGVCVLVILLVATTRLYKQMLTEFTPVPIFLAVVCPGGNLMRVHACKPLTDAIHTCFLFV